jgi:hypothetical protein
MNWIKSRWREVSTKLGLFLTAAGPLLQQYAQYDVRFAYAAAALGLLLICLKEPANG